MFKKLFVLLLLLPVLVGANDLSVVYTDGIGADMAAETVRDDTVYTNWIDIRGFNSVHFYSKLSPYGSYSDTNFADDTFWVIIQTSFDRIGLKTHLIDTFLTTDSSWSALKLNTSDYIFGNWMRGMLIHWDTLGADSPGLEDNEYSKKLEVWIAPKK